MFLVNEPIDPVDFVNVPQDFRSGANVLFLGIVRNHSEAKKVLFLEYEAYSEMAERLLGELIARARQEWKLEAVKLLHRLGKVGLGEIAVAIGVWSAHRGEAYQASRYLIEEIKYRVPIWKKEYFEDGTCRWSECCHADLQTSA